MNQCTKWVFHNTLPCDDEKMIMKKKNCGDIETRQRLTHGGERVYKLHIEHATVVVILNGAMLLHANCDLITSPYIQLGYSGQPWSIWNRGAGSRDLTD